MRTACSCRAHAKCTAAMHDSSCCPLCITPDSLHQLLGKFISGALPSINLKRKGIGRNSIMHRIWSREKRNFSAEAWLLPARFHNELPEGAIVYQKAKCRLVYLPVKNMTSFYTILNQKSCWQSQWSGFSSETVWLRLLWNRLKKSINFTESLNALSSDHTLCLNIMVYWHFNHWLL